jgi:type IV pilus assembly protein PilA
MERSQGLTLIELMIVVAIIGILAAIAIPNFIRFQLRSKSSEGRLNLAGIRTAQAGYFADSGFYVACSSAPMASGTPPGNRKVAFPACSNNPPLSTDPGFCFIGWQPEGDVLFNYAVATNGAVPMSGAQFFAAAQSDIDGDGNLSAMGINTPDNGGGALAAGPFGCTTVLNQDTGLTVLRQIGPCDSLGYGISVF